MARPEPSLRSRLSPAEYEVLQAIVQGDSHAQIAVSRDRSARTVANQLQSISDKLGVCGRFRLINLAVATAVL
jgi:DNA-binding CsgD family transcriptional regulator